jgi:predicted negative regulator of RcsB-dependent stress response
VNKLIQITQGAQIIGNIIVLGIDVASEIQQLVKNKDASYEAVVQDLQGSAIQHATNTLKAVEAWEKSNPAPPADE